MPDAIKEAVKDIKFYLDRIEELTSRNKELEAALNSLFSTFMELNMTHKVCDCHECSVVRSARAALTGEKKDV